MTHVSGEPGELCLEALVLHVICQDMGLRWPPGTRSGYISNQAAQVIQYLFADNLNLNKMGLLQIATGSLSCPLGVEAISQVMTVSHGKTWQCRACVVHGSNHIRIETNRETEAVT